MIPPYLHKVHEAFTVIFYTDDNLLAQKCIKLFSAKYDDDTIY